MSEIARHMPRLALVGVLLLGAAGCSETVRGDLFPDLNCGAKPGNSKKNTYDISTDARVLFGHTEFDRSFRADASVTLSPDGKLTVLPNKTDIAIQVGENGAHVVAGDEQFTITSVPQDGRYEITIIGECVELPK